MALNSSATNYCPNHFPDTIFFIQTFCGSVLPFVGLIGHVILLKRIVQVPLLPANARAILANLSVAAIIFNSSQFIRFAIYHPLLLIFGFRIFAIEAGNCLFWLLPYGCSGSAMMLFIWTLCVERFSYVLRAPDPAERLQLWAKILIGVLWFVSPLPVASRIFFPNSTVLCYCHTTFASSRTVFIVMASVFTAFGILSFLCLILHWFRMEAKYLRDNMNQHKNSAHRINERFRRWQTLNLTKMLIPSGALSVLCFIWIFGLQLTVVSVDFKTPITQINLLSASSLVALLWTGSHPWLCMLMNRHMRPGWEWAVKKVQYDEGVSVSIFGYKLRPDEAAEMFKTDWDMEASRSKRSLRYSLMKKRRSESLLAASTKI